MTIGDQTEARAFGATWRNELTGEIVGTAFGGTVCWFPRKPWAIKLGSDDWEFPARCRECPGCLELDRRYLADRLKAKYQHDGGKRKGIPGSRARRDPAGCARHEPALSAVRIFTPTYNQSALSRKLHRRLGLELEPGFWRMGTASFAVLAREPNAVVVSLARDGIKSQAYKINLSRGRRAWRALTAGITIAREAYGEHLNRFYVRGLPKRDKMDWARKPGAMQKPWRRATSARVRTGRGLVLVPPELWRMPRTIRRDLRALMAAATTPEETKQALQVIADAFAGRSRQLDSNQPRGARLTREQVAESYRLMAERKAARLSSFPETGSITLSLSERGYTTSVHGGPSPPPRFGSDAELLELGPSGKPRWIEREIADRESIKAREAAAAHKFKQELETWTEKMIRLSKLRKEQS